MLSRACINSCLPISLAGSPELFTDGVTINFWDEESYCCSQGDTSVTEKRKQLRLQ